MIIFRRIMIRQKIPVVVHHWLHTHITATSIGHRVNETTYPYIRENVRVTKKKKKPSDADLHRDKLEHERI